MGPQPTRQCAGCQQVTAGQVDQGHRVQDGLDGLARQQLRVAPGRAVQLSVQQPARDQIIIGVQWLVTWTDSPAATARRISPLLLRISRWVTVRT